MEIIYNIIKSNLPLFISIIALLFSISSFWWIHWRRGKIVVSFPIKFSLNFNSNSKKLIIGLPLVFYNNGASSIIVNNLRLKLFDRNHKEQLLHFNNTFLDLETDRERQLGYAFPIEGRKSYSKVFVFMKSGIDFEIPNEKLKVNLQAQVNNDYKWIELLKISLLTPEIHHQTMREILRAYNNY